MPTYTFYDEASGIEWDDFLSIADKEKFLKENPQIKQVFQPIAIAGDHLMGVGPKESGAFNETMSKIAEKHPSSSLANKYGSETFTKRKTRDVVRKHLMNK